MRACVRDAPTRVDEKCRSGMRRCVSLALKLVYPAVILGALRMDEPRLAGLALLVTLWLQRWLDAGAVGAMLRKLSALDLCVALVLSGASAIIAITNSELALRCYPSLVNLGLFVSFAATLARPPSMIERFARLRDPDPAPHVVRYTRRVTQAWCAFFVANAIFSAFTAWAFSRQTWALYNGVLAYVLIGGLIVGEWTWRRLVLRASAKGRAQ